MNKTGLSIANVGLAVLLAACGSSGTGTSPQGGSNGSGGSGTGGSSANGSGGSSSNPSGGASSSGKGGAAGNPSGGSVNGSGGKAAGGTAGNPSGGAAGNGSGGTAAGGAAGTGSGGAAGSGAGGSTGDGSGGSAGNGAGGSAGNGAGGKTAAGGTTGAGGAAGGTTTPGGGGNPAGGVQGTGGTTPAGTGGATTASTTLVTSTNGSWTASAMPTEAASGTPDVTVNDTAAQTWEGFGGCFNEMGWNQLSTAALQTEAINLLFGTDGAHFVMGRIPIGASDYAMNRYTLDDPASDNDPTATSSGSNRPAADTAMANFKIDRDKDKLIPYIQAALAVNPNLRLWASPWTPPVWMKTGYKTTSGAPGAQKTTPAVKPSYYDGGNMSSDSATLTAYAQYYTKWVQAYKDNNIKIEMVSPQNEPGYDQNYPSCLWDSATYTSWIGKYLGPAMKTLGVKVMAGTLSNNSSGTDEDLAKAALKDSTASGFLSVVGVQWGVLDDLNSGSFSPGGGIPVWATEHKCGNYPWTTSTYKPTAPNDQAYAVESWGYIRDAINKGGVTAYNAWNMVLDNVGKGIDTSRDWAQDSLLTVSGGKITQTQAYYVFRHFSQFVDAGAKVLKPSGSTDAVAFKNPDGSLVAVVYSSSAKSNYIVAIGGKNLQFNIPAGGWATVKYKP